MSPAEIIRKAREHISDPAMWYQGGSYRLHEARPTLENGKACCGYYACTLSALGSTSPRKWWYDALHAAAEEKGFPSFGDFNDHPDTTHADVLAVMDRAAELAEEFEQKQHP